MIIITKNDARQLNPLKLAGCSSHGVGVLLPRVELVDFKQTINANCRAFSNIYWVSPYKLARVKTSPAYGVSKELDNTVCRSIPASRRREAISMDPFWILGYVIAFQVGILVSTFAILLTNIL